MGEISEYQGLTNYQFLGEISKLSKEIQEGFLGGKNIEEKIASFQVLISTKKVTTFDEFRGKTTREIALLLKNMDNIVLRDQIRQENVFINEYLSALKQLLQFFHKNINQNNCDIHIINFIQYLQDTRASTDLGYSVDDLILGKDTTEVFSGGYYAFFFYRDQQGKIQFFNGPYASHFALWDYLRQQVPFYKYYTATFTQTLVDNRLKIIPHIKDREGKEIDTKSVIVYAGDLFVDKEKKSIQLTGVRSGSFDTELNPNYFINFMQERFSDREVKTDFVIT